MQLTIGPLRRGQYVFVLGFTALCIIVAGSMAAQAIEPTELKRASSGEIGVLEIQLIGEYEDFNSGHESTLEAKLSYGINDHLRLGLNVPFDWKEEGEDGIGDIGAYLKWTVNPDSDGIVVGGQLELTAPTGEYSEGVGGEAQLRFSKSFAEKHGLHLTLKGYYESVDVEHDYLLGRDDDDDHPHLFDHDETDREFGYMAVLGYTFKPVDSTMLIADVAVGEAAEEGENTNLIELGLTHEFNETVECGVGIGAGLDDDSPDFVAHAGLEFKFGGHK